MKHRAKDWLFTGAFVLLVAGLVVIGWLNRDDYGGPPGSGEAAPAFTAERLKGGSASLEDFRGQVVLLNLWATWCAPCRHEMPSMQRLYERYRGDGLEIVAVSVDRAPGRLDAEGRRPGVVQDFVDEYGLTFPVLLDPRGEIEARYGVTGLPTTLLIDRDGRIRKRVIGGAEWDTEPYSSMVQALLED